MNRFLRGLKAAPLHSILHCGELLVFIELIACDEPFILELAGRWPIIASNTTPSDADPRTSGFRKD